MITLINIDEMREILQKFVDQHSSQHAAAKTLGISPAFLSDMLLGKDVVSPKVASRLGYTRDWWYAAKDQ